MVLFRPNNDRLGPKPARLNKFDPHRSESARIRRDPFRLVQKLGTAKCIYTPAAPQKTSLLRESDVSGKKRRREISTYAQDLKNHKSCFVRIFFIRHFSRGVFVCCIFRVAGNFIHFK